MLNKKKNISEKILTFFYGQTYLHLYYEFVFH